jgi:hypothetical protein
MTLSTCLRGMTKNSFFCIYGLFRELCPQFCGFGVTYKANDTQYMFERHEQKLVILML